MLRLLLCSLFVFRARCSYCMHTTGDEEAVSLLQQGLQFKERVESEPSKLGQRLHIISVTGLGTYEKLAIVNQESWGKRLGANDNYTNICDVGCGRVEFNGRRLEHILPMKDADFPSGACRSNCSGYIRAQYKFVWGFVTSYRQLASRGGPMPQWWFIKDDDTYVDIDRLMAVAGNYNPNKRVFLANFWNNTKEYVPGTKYTGIRGGAGWLASAAMAEEMVQTHGDQWLKLQAMAPEVARTTGIKEAVVYDQYVAAVLDLVGDLEAVDMKDKGFLNPDMPGQNGFYIGDAFTSCPDRSIISFHMKLWRANTTDPYEMTKMTNNCLEG